MVDGTSLAKSGPKATLKHKVDQHMQGLLEKGKVSEFFHKARYEDEFLMSSFKDKSLAQRLGTFFRNRTSDIAYNGFRKQAQHQFKGVQDAALEPNFEHLKAEVLIDELDHQADRFRIVGNDSKVNIFEQASKALAGRGEMSVLDALKALGREKGSLKKIEAALTVKPESIKKETVALRELRQNVEILEMEVNAAALAEQKASATQISPKRAALRQELTKARADLKAASNDSKVAETLFQKLTASKATEGEVITAAERAKLNPVEVPEDTPALPSESLVKDAVREVGSKLGTASLLGAMAGLGLVGIGIAFAAGSMPGIGAMLNFAEPRKGFLGPAGAVANVLGTVALVAHPNPAVSLSLLGASGAAFVLSSFLD